MSEQLDVIVMRLQATSDPFAKVVVEGPDLIDLKGSVIVGIHGLGTKVCRVRSKSE